MVAYFRRQWWNFCDGNVHVGKERPDLLHPDVQDFIQDRASHCLSKAQFEKPARTGEAGDQRLGCQSVARLASNHLDGFEDSGLAPAVAHCRFAADNHERAYGGGKAVGLAAMTSRLRRH